MKRLCAALVVVGACATPMPHASPDQLLRAQRQDASITEEGLEQGRSLYLGHCGSCHAPRAPSSPPKEGWDAAVNDMSQHAHLSAEEAALVRAYLNALQAP